MKLDHLRHLLEGLSANGSMGLGGSAEGFEKQNQGVTRRRPGEGPKANGGRSQSQEMDSFDQPQFNNEDFMGIRRSDTIETQTKLSEVFRFLSEEESAEIELIDDPSWSEQEKTFGRTDGDKIIVQTNGRHPMDVLRTVAHELSHWENGDTDGHTGSDDENRANAEAGENMRDLADEMPQMFGGLNESLAHELVEEGVLDEGGAEMEYGEHGEDIKGLGYSEKESKTIAKTIAAGHRREDPNYYRPGHAGAMSEGIEMKVTLKEFFNVEEASQGNIVQQMAELGWEWKGGKYRKGQMMIDKDPQGAGISTADEETYGYQDMYNLYGPNQKGFLGLIASGPDLLKLAQEHG